MINDSMKSCYIYRCNFSITLISFILVCLVFSRKIFKKICNFSLQYLLSENKCQSLYRGKYFFVIKKKIGKDTGCRVIDRMQIAGR